MSQCGTDRGLNMRDAQSIGNERLHGGHLITLIVVVCPGGWENERPTACGQTNGRRTMVVIGCEERSSRCEKEEKEEKEGCMFVLLTESLSRGFSTNTENSCLLAKEFQHGLYCMYCSPHTVALI